MDWYNEPGNRIREADEKMGVRLVINPSNGMACYTVVDHDRFFADCKPPQTYPEYFQNRTFDDFIVNLYTFGDKRETARQALEKTVRYVKHLDKIIEDYGGSGLYYFSKERGSGKTFLSTIAGNEMAKLGYRVRWYNMTNLIQEIKAGFDKDSSTSSAEVINQARNAQVLILDDIGVEKQSAWLNETVYTIMDHRMSHCKPTIFTSNHLPEDLNYDERIIDRITRMTELIRMPEESIRRILNAGNNFSTFLAAKEG